ncbi:hypothetical protein HF576_07825 [Microbacterium sp. CFH 90308]|uniref:Integral membrane protein n=1 Tax=Microbacterium salsuginis TaxID=2722803 RepID=A0ABX1KB83_9MICO|nr:hypothetical protein [Microbacterium sp. CFH 90308]NLP83752.1 hypothetical protein [Microbacterium sp. CFH 90308]
MSPRHVRAVRGTAAAAVATVVAATAHTLAGGGAPAPLLVAAVAILGSPFATALIGRRLSPWRVASAVLVSQVLFHVAFAITAGADPGATAGHHAHHLALPGTSAAVLPDGPMTVGHVLAAIATVLALYFGERMLRALGRGIRSLFARARAIAPRPPVPRLVATVPRPLPRLRIVLSGLSRRGPPSLVFAAR